MPVLDYNAYELELFDEGRHYYDDNGDLVRESGGWRRIGRCNAVPAGRNNVINLPNEDGKAVSFSFTIILHNPDSREFQFGERIRLKTVHSKEVRELTVKGFARYQHQCKIYA